MVGVSPSIESTARLRVRHFIVCCCRCDILGFLVIFGSPHSSNRLCPCKSRVEYLLASVLPIFLPSGSNSSFVACASVSFELSVSSFHSHPRTIRGRIRLLIMRASPFYSNQHRLEQILIDFPTTTCTLLSFPYPLFAVVDYSRVRFGLPRPLGARGCGRGGSSVPSLCLDFKKRARRKAT